jgi:hypothetical protein
MVLERHREPIIIGRKVRGQENEVHRGLPREKVVQIYQIFVDLRLLTDRIKHALIIQTVRSGFVGSAHFDRLWTQYEERHMESFSGLIGILLEHSQRFIDFWNLHLVIVIGVLGFSLANSEIVARRNVRLLIMFMFVAIAVFSVFSLSVHQERAEKLWLAMEARITATSGEFIPEEVAYIDALKPTPFIVKAGAIVAADILVIFVIWFMPKIRPQE